MNQLTVKKVEFYGDETASVTLESEISSIEVFCHPCEYEVGDKVKNHLNVLDADVKAAYLSDWPVETIEQASRERIERIGPYSYVDCGKVIDQKEGIIEVNGFQIELNDVPCDGAVEFNIERLDLW
jgi:hypothetical protein